MTSHTLVLSITVFDCEASSYKSEGDPVIIAEVHDLKHVSWFFRTTATEYVRFASRQIAFAVKNSDRPLTFAYDGIAEEDNSSDEEKVALFKAHAYRVDNLAAVVICLATLPLRIPLSIARKAIFHFQNLYGPGNAIQVLDGKDTRLEQKFMQQLLEVDFVEMVKNDSILKVSTQVDETLEAVIKAQKQLLKRGEDIESLVARSEDLSANSKRFFIVSRKMNRRCCTII